MGIVLLHRNGLSRTVRLLADFHIKGERALSESFIRGGWHARRQPHTP